MYLYEEYFQRNGIQVAVYPPQPVCLILRSTNRIPSVLRSTWSTSSTRPGTFDFRLLVPTHNGWEHGQFWNVLSNQTLYWDQFQTYLPRFVTAIGSVLSQRNEIRLALWEMFLVVYDSWLAIISNKSLLNEISLSIRIDNPTRMESHFRAIGALENCYASYRGKNGESERKMSSIFEKDFLILSKEYSNHLAMNFKA